ncbi:hypothetical protein [Adhaeretor mobilis]|uniref:Uncharacterized protein n=1 Tax=Adhaeretor mobilis TaxID=1930276 RepID=A0A517N344_9BACT|nr:hypothetical protein [Adhaeretor mobilis]QDT01557.1 hypothetical protein HG15A2_49040 [Adhaeretor mobilis]
MLAIPQLNFAFLWKLPVVFGAILLMALLDLGAQCLSKPTVKLLADRLIYSHVQSAGNKVKFEYIRESRLTIFSHNRVLLTIWYDQKRRRRRVRMGVAEKVALDELAELLPVTPTIRDARATYQRLFPTSNPK